MAIERVDVFDHKAFGEMVVRWSVDPTTRPADIDAMREACTDILSIPDRITKLDYVDVDLDTLVIRVPNRDMVIESRDRFQAAPDGNDYPMPPFYDWIGTQAPPPALDILYSRISDYTIAQCL